LSNTIAWFTWWGVLLVGAAWEITTSDKRIARSKYNFMISFLKREGSILWYRILKVVQNEAGNAVKIREYLYC
ncbi:20510_t:CDS:2, partial [Rhizophagus irregularis]